LKPPTSYNIYYKPWNSATYISAERYRITPPILSGAFTSLSSARQGELMGNAGKQWKTYIIAG